jgi:hypothetical protein
MVMAKGHRGLEAWEKHGDSDDTMVAASRDTRQRLFVSARLGGLANLSVDS